MQYLFGALRVRAISKVNVYTFRGRNSTIFIVVSLLRGGQFFKKRLCSLRSKIFSKSGPIVDRIYSPRQQIVSHKSSPFVQESQQEVTIVPLCPGKQARGHNCSPLSRKASRPQKLFPFVQESQQEVTKVVSLCKNFRKT